MHMRHERHLMWTVFIGVLVLIGIAIVSHYDLRLPSGSLFLFTEGVSGCSA